MQTNEKEVLLNLSKKELNLFNTIKLYKLLLKLSNDDLPLVKLFLNSYYNIEFLPEDLYKTFLYLINTDKYKELFTILLKRNIYDLINFFKSEKEIIKNVNNIINPIDYFKLPTKQIKYIFHLLKNIDFKNDDLLLKKLLLNKPEWKIKPTCFNTDEELMKIAIKMYLSIGLDNTIDLLNGKYGVIDYEIIYYLFNNLNTKDINNDNNVVFNEFLFNNKKDANNIMRLVLEGNFMELFINFDYFYNNLSYYIELLGTKFNRIKLSILLKEKYIASLIENPEINGNVIEDMVSSYYHKYDITDNRRQIINKNMDAYAKLKLKNKSSIIQVSIPKFGEFNFELLPLDDIRNLVIGYRAGNCFRINGDAFVLFHNFLTNPHMRILSISTDKYKDFGMVLLMRNGNVLIAQGIEMSKRVSDIDSEELYNSVRMAIKFIMDKINSENDEIVASIIGLSNSNTAPYNHNILPFIINPILDSSNNFYNGVYNYQGLLDLKNGKTLKDIKLFIPSSLYSDNNNKIYRRNEFTSLNSVSYREIEKILISLRYEKFRKAKMEESINYYNNLFEKREVYAVCTLNWYIRVFQDGFIDTYLNSDNPTIVEEYNLEMQKIEREFSKQKLIKEKKNILRK